MKLRIQRSEDGHPELWIQDRPVIRGLGAEIAATAAAEDVLKASPWEAPEGLETGEAFHALVREVTSNGTLLWTEEIRADGESALFAVEIKSPIRNISTEDSFETFSLTSPHMEFTPGHRFFLTTYGLGPSGNGGVGGYWPEAMVVDDLRSFPEKAFAPLVAFNGQYAVAIAPSSQYLTSSLIRDKDRIVRTLHGAVNEIPPGTRIETLFVSGSDISSALMQAGNLLLSRSGKHRPDPQQHTMTSTLGWWNAYGGYYTEPIHPLTGDVLEQLVESLKTQQVPVKYLGLDLWYPYKLIGQALRFAPDTEKYPNGVGHIARKFEMPTVLHLSALSEENEYNANGSDPSFYNHVASELRAQEAQVAWHDWLRTQQHLTPRLRSDIGAADAWFQGMSSAMAREGISIMTCMQTMGMILGSTQLPNVIAARSSIDYLFAQQEALATLEQLGEPGFWNEETPLPVMRRQNLLVGFTYYAMGLLPFYDLFLTRWHEGVGGLSPRAEGVLRSLSCGPIGIGDGPGKTDVALLRFLMSEDGRLLQPDHPPFPDTATMGEPIEVYRTERSVGNEQWDYVLALNTTDSKQAFNLEAIPDDRVAWDVMQGCIVERLQGDLPPGEIACFLLAPIHEGIAPLGFTEKSVPASTISIREATWDGRWQIELDAVAERFAVWSDSALRVSDQDGNELMIERTGPLTGIAVGEGVSSLAVARR